MTNEAVPIETPEGTASARVAAPNGVRVTFNDSTAWNSPDTRHIRHDDDDVLMFDNENRQTALLRWSSLKSIAVLRGRGPLAAHD